VVVPAGPAGARSGSKDPPEGPGRRPRGPLTGTRVIDTSTVGPAARCTRLLADYGSDVVKVGPVPARGAEAVAAPFYAYSGHRGMRQARVDLKEEGGRQAFLALARISDVVVESFRPGVADRLGIGYEAVREVNPGVVYCSTSGYGQSGPKAGWAGHDLDYLGFGGFLATTGPRADGAPPVPGATLADAAAGGMHAALAIVASLLARRQTGDGARLDVSVAEGVLWLMSLAIDEHLATGAEPGPGHDILTGRYACYDTYLARDGKALAVAVVEPKFFANLCRALGCERWVGHQLDDTVQDEIRADFRSAFATRDRDEWAALLGPADTCVAPVLSVGEVVGDPQVLQRGAIIEAVHPDGRRFRQLAPLLAGMPRPAGAVEVADPSRTDTASLLREAGVGAETIAGWEARGCVA
jgi:alpha-methylacyl-CoA racemase